MVLEGRRLTRLVRRWKIETSQLCTGCSVLFCSTERGRFKWGEAGPENDPGRACPETDEWGAAEEECVEGAVTHVVSNVAALVIGRGKKHYAGSKTVPASIKEKETRWPEVP